MCLDMSVYVYYSADGLFARVSWDLFCSRDSGGGRAIVGVCVMLWMLGSGRLGLGWRDLWGWPILRGLVG